MWLYEGINSHCPMMMPVFAFCELILDQIPKNPCLIAGSIIFRNSIAITV